MWDHKIFVCSCVHVDCICRLDYSLPISSSLWFSIICTPPLQPCQGTSLQHPHYTPLRSTGRLIYFTNCPTFIPCKVWNQLCKSAIKMNILLPWMYSMWPAAVCCSPFVPSISMGKGGDESGASKQCCVYAGEWSVDQRAQFKNNENSNWIWIADITTAYAVQTLYL